MELAAAQPRWGGRSDLGTSVSDMSDTQALTPVTRDADDAARDALDWRQVLRIFFRTWPFIRPSLKHLAAFVAVSAVMFVFGAGMTLLLIGLATSGIMSAEPLGEVFILIYGLDPAQYLDVERLSDEARLALSWPTVNTAIVLTLVGTTVGYAMYYYSIWIFQSINQRMRVRLIEQLQAQSLTYHARAQTGDAIYRLYQDSAMVTAIIRSVFLEPLMFAGRYLAGVVVVAAFSPALALVLMLTLFPILLLGWYFSGRLRVQFRAARERNAALTSWIQESVQGIRVIKATGAEGGRAQTFGERSVSALGAAFRSRVGLNVMAILAFATIGIATITIQSLMAMMSSVEASVFARDLLLAFGFAVWNFGTFSAAGSRAADATGSLVALIGLWGRAQDMAVGLGRVFEILDLEPDIVDKPDATSLAPFADEVRFDGMSFAYLPDRPVLQDVSFVAPKGTVTAIVGPTGTGKSTLMSLLLRLVEPDNGRVTVDGTDVSDVTLDSLRQSASIATQENILFSASVLENIRYAAPDATEEEVIAAATVACADDFIRALPDGYHTDLGERAAKLSSGQRQRIVLARALVRDTRLVILDEPTAALDAETELNVLENLKAWGENRCIFLITHRLSTARHASQVVYLDDGAVAACGEHAELLESNQQYRAFVAAEGA